MTTLNRKKFLLYILRTCHVKVNHRLLTELCCSVVILLFYVLFVLIVLFYVLFVCKCVQYYCQRVASHLQMTNTSYHIKRSGFNSRTVHVGFVVDEIGLRPHFLRLQLFAWPVSFHRFPILIQSTTNAVK